MLESKSDLVADSAQAVASPDAFAAAPRSSRSAACCANTFSVILTAVSAGLPAADAPTAWVAGAITCVEAMRAALLAAEGPAGR